jgi:hypothetical protein
MQYVPQLPHPTRTIVVPLLAATLGAGLAVATFAIVNIEDDATVSAPAPVVQSAPPSDAVAGQRNDGGPAEGAAQQIMTPAAALQAAAAGARNDGGPAEGAAQQIMRPAVEPQGAEAAGTASATPRYDGGPNEGSSASATAQPAEGTTGP